MKINNVKREKGRASNRFCGPAILSIVTGYDTADTAAILRHLGNVRKITGTSDGQILTALKAFGITAQSTFFQTGPAKRRVTLAAWLKRSKADRTAGRVYLVSAGSHWQIVSGRRYVCGQTSEIVSIKDKRVKRRARVRQVWELTGKVRRPECLDAIDATVAKRRAVVNGHAKARRQAKAIEAEGWAEIEYERFSNDPGMWWVGPGKKFEGFSMDGVPEQCYDISPGDHYVDDWDEVLERAEEQKARGIELLGKGDDA